MSLPGRLLKRLDWRRGLQTSAPASDAEDIDPDVPQAFVKDVDIEDLREFMGPIKEGEHADPVFERRLRVLLWGVMSHRRGRVLQSDHRAN